MSGHTVNVMSTMQPLQERSSRLLSAEEVGQALGIDVSTVYRMAGDGRLPARKVGRQWRFPAEAVIPPPAAHGIDPQLAFATIGIAADLLGVMMVVTDLSGYPVTPVANPCPRFRRADDASVAACVSEWQATAAGLDLGTRFRRSHLGFDCASAFIRSGDRLLGLVIAGGIGLPDQPEEGLYLLTDEDRALVLTSLPRIAAAVAERSAS